MKLEEYKDTAIQRLNKSILYDKKENMNYAFMGLIEETGEIIAELRKSLFKGNFHEKALNKEGIKGELGDLMWYIALICKNLNIDMNQLKEKNQKEEIDIAKREIMIYTAIKMGEISGKIIEQYQQVEKGNSLQNLIEKIQEQYQNVCELANQLDLTLDEILEANIEKAYSRYNEEGKSTREYEK